MDASEILTTARELLARDQAADAHILLLEGFAGHPETIDVLLVIAEALTELDRPADATGAYRGVLALDPQHPIALAKVQEAVAAMETLLRLASIADDAGAWEEARENYEAVLYQYPHSILSLTRLLALDGFEGRLGDAERHLRALDRALRATDLMTIHPNNLAMIAYRAIFRPLPRSTQAAVTDALSRQSLELAEKFPPLPAPLPKSNGRLRVGYLSIHFRDHPVGHVTAALFAAHDRAKVEVHVFYLPAGGENPYTDQIKAGAEHFHTASDAEGMVRAIARQNLDILVYLDGYMAPFLLPVMARRPAPVQVYWLGHAGACETAGIDYVLADDTVVPPGEEALYRPEVVRLPTYHPASPHALGPDMTRTEAGLPETGFVFCAFNNPEKIDTPTFDLWTRILKRVPGSLLWLSRTQSAAIVENLRKEAEARGIAGKRIVFATRVADKAAHFARHRHAGLFLDTLGLNASTTGLDALWAGLPLLTVTGPRFASRIASTFLKTLGLTDLICRTPGEFEERAVHLATSPDALTDVRKRLATTRTTGPLFQIEAFCRTLEAALMGLHAKHRR
jgi:predicted O-linked N-acetylglucosamine transferase (SPINDLY family)